MQAPKRDCRTIEARPPSPLTLRAANGCGDGDPVPTERGWRSHGSEMVALTPGRLRRSSPSPEGGREVAPRAKRKWLQRLLMVASVDGDRGVNAANSSAEVASPANVAPMSWGSKTSLFGPSWNSSQAISPAPLIAAQTRNARRVAVRSAARFWSHQMLSRTKVIAIAAAKLGMTLTRYSVGRESVSVAPRSWCAPVSKASPPIPAKP